MEAERQNVANFVAAGYQLFVWIILPGVLSLPSSLVYAAGILNTNVDGANCKGCHQNEDVLPKGHPETVSMTYSNCINCHIQKKISMQPPLSLGHIHLLNGVVCGNCHSDLKAPAPLNNDDCFECHDSAAEVAERTAERDPNPHNSIHYGTDLDCDMCHHQHKPSENYCAFCHDSTLEVP